MFQIACRIFARLSLTPLNVDSLRGDQGSWRKLHRKSAGTAAKSKRRRLMRGHVRKRPEADIGAVRTRPSISHRELTFTQLVVHDPSQTVKGLPKAAANVRPKADGMLICKVDLRGLFAPLKCQLQ